MNGSEKQVSWATEILESYKAVAEQLREAVAVMEDLTQEERVTVDPIFQKERKYLVYASNLAGSHEAALRTAEEWRPERANRASASSRYAELEAQGNAHAYRMAQKERIQATLAALEAAIENEESAKYWIDRRS